MSVDLAAPSGDSDFALRLDTHQRMVHLNFDTIGKWIHDAYSGSHNRLLRRAIRRAIRDKHRRMCGGNTRTGRAHCPICHTYSVCTRTGICVPYKNPSNPMMSLHHNMDIFSKVSKIPVISRTNFIYSKDTHIDVPGDHDTDRSRFYIFWPRTFW